MNDEKHDDDNPWDEDDGARTLATDGPSFELPSNIPSPITVPPPVAVPKVNPKSTLVGLMPADVRASLANRPPPRPGGPPRSQPKPVTIPDDALDELPGQQDDGPTMMGAGASPNVPLRDDFAQQGFAPAHRMNDANAETMALDRDDERLPNLDDEPESDEAATRALTREQMMGPGAVHQDAHVIVGSDARGDEATLAIGPDQLGSAFGELGASLEPALAEALAQRVAEHHQQVQQQAYQQQYPQAPPPQAPHFPQPQTQQHFSPQQQPQFAQPQPQPAGYGMPQPGTQPGAYPPSGQHPAAYPPSGQQPVMGPPSNAWGASQGYAGQAPSQQQQQQQQPAAWNQPPAPLAQPSGGGGFQITSQIMVLAGVGVVCLAIFVVGLVLFFTTKF